ncbi:MAG: RsmB/NOP family class I SAM-dependent RNA methyltransferase, partial [Victivallales bacterium]|nr:RsmB/NOP family class I SAM-dependent RNA methyltransferase [Victivallales bacterium]
DFLRLAASARLPGEGVPEDATPLLKNLWFSMNRRRASFDWLIQTHCRRLRPGMEWLLRWAFTECYVLDQLPPPVAVSVMVDEAKRRFSTPEASFLNAVARRVLREAPNSSALQRLVAEKAPPAVQCELPQTLYERWRRTHGEARVRELSALLQAPAAVTGRRRGCFAGREATWPLKVEEFVQESPEGFDLREYYLQDASTLMAPLLLGARPGEAVADLCAAPGGKALILAELLDGQGTLYACDASEARLGRLRENLAGFANVRIERQNAERPRLAPASLDALLLDVPCSNTGVIRRRPDVRWNFAEAELRRLVAEQRRILEGASPLVKAGGRLVYSTCSIEPEENARQVRHFLERHPEFTLAAEEQLYPAATHDGAFAARLEKKA